MNDKELIYRAIMMGSASVGLSDGRNVKLPSPQRTGTIQQRKAYARITAEKIVKGDGLKERLTYIEETYAGEYETWQDPKTGDYYRVPITIERDWDNIEKI